MALFEKLAPAGRAKSRPAAAPATIERILANLEHVLNGKRGFSSRLLPDFGIRTLTEYQSRESLAPAVMRDVQECVARYEPRLRLDSIAIDDRPSPLRLSFTLRCTLVGDAHELSISFDTVFNQFDVARR